MTGLPIIFDEPAWPDLQSKFVLTSEDISIAALESGMASGRPSVAIRVNLSDGSVVIAQTSARLFAAAARAMMARYPDLFEGN